MTVENEISKSDFTLADFYSSWCGPCKSISPIIDEIAEKHKGFNVIKINIDKDTETARRYGVMSVPTLIFFKNGNAVERLSGIYDRKTLNYKIEKCLKNYFIK